MLEDDFGHLPGVDAEERTGNMSELPMAAAIRPVELPFTRTAGPVTVEAPTLLTTRPSYNANLATAFSFHSMPCPGLSGTTR